MSSSFQFVCMSHDPAMLVGRDYSRGEVAVDTVADAIAEVREHHPSCDLALTRESGAIVEAGCVTAGHGHAVPRWVDMDVLRVVLHARTTEHEAPALAWALDRLFDARQRWPQERIWRLKAVAQLEPAYLDDEREVAS